MQLTLTTDETHSIPKYNEVLICVSLTCTCAKSTLFRSLSIWLICEVFCRTARAACARWFSDVYLRNVWENAFTAESYRGQCRVLLTWPLVVNMSTFITVMFDTDVEWLHGEELHTRNCNKMLTRKTIFFSTRKQGKNTTKTYQSKKKNVHGLCWH